MFMKRLLVGATALVLAATPALAQVNDDQVIEEIVVTATKFSTSLMDTPLAVSAFTEDQLDRLNISNVKDLNNLVPNMSIMVDVESSAPIITMRGVRSTNTTEWGDPAVGVHYDGIYSPRPQGALALMFDIDRVEVLRGPQGTLFGRNSTVGSANIISTRPKFEDFSAKVVAEVGRYQQQSIKGVLNIPVSDTFAIRAATFFERQDSNMDGYYDPNQWDQRYMREMGYTEDMLTPVDVAATEAGNNADYRFFFRDQLYAEIPADPSDFYNSKNNAAFRISGYWKPSDELAWLLTFERYRDKSAGGINARDCKRIANRPADVNGGSCTDIWGNENNFVGYVNVPGKNDMTLDSIRSSFTYALTDNIEFSYNLGFQSQERTGQIDLDQGYYFWDQMLKWVDTDYDSWSHELQLKSSGDGKLQWVAGYFNLEEDNYMNGQYHGAMGGVSLWLQPKRVIKSDAIFAQGTYALTEKLFLTLGARYTEDSKKDIGGHNYGCWSGGDNSPLPGTCYPAVAWDNVRWDLIDWGTFPDYDAQSQAFQDSTGLTRAALNALPSNEFDYYNPNSYNWNTDTTNDVYEEWSKTTWRVGLDYDFSDNTMVYGYVANGYKGGGIGDVLIKPSDGERFNTSYGPEEVITYELGVKTKALNGTLNLRANAFFSDYEGQQFTTWTIFDTETLVEIDPGTGNPIERIQEYGTFLTRNASDSRISGIELEAEWNAWDGGFIGGYLTTLDTEIESDYWKSWGTEPGQVFAGHFDSDLDTSLPWFRNLKGNDLAYSPKYSFTLNIGHTFNLPNGATLSPFFNVHWEDDSYVSIDNTDKWDLDPSVLNPGIDLSIYSDKRDAWALANVSLNYTSAEKNWFAEAWANNVTNEDVNWWQGYSGNTPMAAKAQRAYGLRFGYNWD
jgi:iron complex outermembrane recepter protein